VVVLVLDNDGGGIFEFLPQAAHRDVFEEVFATPLGMRMEDVAALYGLDFVLATERSYLEDALRRAFAAGRPTMVCARFTRQTSVEGHRACWRAAAAAVEG
jgi:2-succinyl-5-enolpyruvyl-6-hydroxy-3-cyclohexene-1-carboxylate synthase